MVLEGLLEHQVHDLQVRGDGVRRSRAAPRGVRSLPRGAVGTSRSGRPGGSCAAIAVGVRSRQPPASAAARGPRRTVRRPSGCVPGRAAGRSRAPPPRPRRRARRPPPPRRPRRGRARARPRCGRRRGPAPRSSRATAPRDRSPPAAGASTTHSPPPRTRPLPRRLDRSSVHGVRSASRSATSAGTSSWSGRRATHPSGSAGPEVAPPDSWLIGTGAAHARSRRGRSRRCRPRPGSGAPGRTDSRGASGAPGRGSPDFFAWWVTAAVTKRPPIRMKAMPLAM